MKSSKSISGLKVDILDKSKDLFQRFGYHKTTLTDIAKSVGKVKTAVYYYFSGKEEIFAQLVEKEADSFFTKLQNEVEKAESPIDQLEKYVDTRIELMQKLSSRYSFLKQEFFELMPLVEENRAEAHQKEIAFIESIIAEGISQNLISSDVTKGSLERNSRFTAEMLVNSLKGLEIQMYVTDKLLIDTKNMASFRSYILYGAITKN
ncbi:MAG: TetR/AcrR family transcriptional regulator [Crocinitomicaceae bacterium]